MTMGRSFLIIQTAFLGDAILATALAESLHASNPDDQISILVRKGHESLFKDHPFIHEVLVWEKRSSKNRNLLRVIRQVRDRKFDGVINLQRFFSTGLITALSGARTRAGYSKNPLSMFFSSRKDHIFGDGTHEVERNLTLISDLTDARITRPKLHPSANDRQILEKVHGKPFVVMAPASVWKTKQMPFHKWIELGKLCAPDHRIVFMGGKNDRALCEDIAAEVGADDSLNLAGELNFLESAAVMSEASMNYVNDSGPLHIASAVNAPVTAFFCSTVPEFGFGPLSDDSNVIESSPRPDCKPCGMHGKKECPLKHFRCGNDIEIDSNIIP
jgi:heptosyltransferase-2